MRGRINDSLARAATRCTLSIYLPIIGPAATAFFFCRVRNRYCSSDEAINVRAAGMFAVSVVKPGFVCRFDGTAGIPTLWI